MAKKRPRTRSVSYAESNCSSSSYNSQEGVYLGKIGTLIADRYEIFNELGTGTFGRVLACIDKQSYEECTVRNKEVVAVKVIRSVKKYVESAETEAKFLSTVKRKFNDLKISEETTNELNLLKQECNKRSDSWCLEIYSNFQWNKHYCLVTEALGLSLYSVIKSNNHKGFSLNSTLIISRQLFAALLFLEKCCKIVHTDLKLENILFVNDNHILEILSRKKHEKIVENLNEYELKIKLIDFGGAYFMNKNKKTTKRRSKKDKQSYRYRYSCVNTRQYRSPEVTLETGWSFPSDIWSAGCIAHEIFSGNLLFKTHDEHEHLALIEQVTKLKFKDEPSFVKLSYRKKEFFYKDDLALRWPPNNSKKYDLSYVDRTLTLGSSTRKYGKNETRGLEQFAEFILKTLEINPKRRLNANEALSKNIELLKVFFKSEESK